MQLFIVPLLLCKSKEMLSKDSILLANAHIMVHWTKCIKWKGAFIKRRDSHKRCDFVYSLKKFYLYQTYLRR